MALERRKIEEFTRGWFVGNFTPTLLVTDAFEAALKHYRAGDHEPRHVHKIAVEFTVIVSGVAMMNGEHVGPGEVITVRPDTAADFRAITNVVTVVLKAPCVRGDKYPDSGDQPIPPETR